MHAIESVGFIVERADEVWVWYQGGCEWQEQWQEAPQEVGYLQEDAGKSAALCNA